MKRFLKSRTTCTRAFRALVVLMAIAGFSGCDVQRRKSDAELGLNPQQSAGRKIYDSDCDRCHEPYSTRGKKGPGLKGMFQHKYLSLSGLPANDERVTDIIRLGRNEMPGYSQTLSSQDIQDLLAYLHTLVAAMAKRHGTSFMGSFQWDNPGMKSAAKSELFRELPSVDELLRTPGVASLAASSWTCRCSPMPHALCSLVCGKKLPQDCWTSPRCDSRLTDWPTPSKQHLRQALRHSLRPVINATGVILHTNLGRAPLAEAALAHIRETAGRFSNLEFDIEAGARGKRDVHVDRLFRICS